MEEKVGKSYKRQVSHPGPAGLGANAMIFKMFTAKKWRKEIGDFE
jgi:hypothetical protein